MARASTAVPVERGTPTAVSHGDRLEFGAVKVELLVGE